MFLSAALSFQGFHKTKFFDLFSEISTIDFSLQNAFVCAFELGKCKFSWKQLDNEGGVRNFGAEAFKRKSNNFIMVIGKRRQVVDGEPPCISGVITFRQREMFPWSESKIGNGNHTTAGIPINSAESVKLFHIDMLFRDARFRCKMPSDCRFGGFFRGNQSSRQAKAVVKERGTMDANDPREEIIVPEGEKRDIRS